MTPARQFLVTGVLIALTPAGCVETDAPLFAPLEKMEGGGDTVELAGSADILEGRLLGDCSGAACGTSGFARTTTIVGDLDGDGRDDLVFGVPGHTRDLYRAAEGAVYVVYGRSTWADEETVEPDAILELAGSHGVNAISVARAGDVDGDGHADFLVGDWNGESCTAKSLEPEEGPYDPSFGSAHLVHGGPTRLSGTLTVTDVASTFVDDGECRGLGASVASAGDLDGDGFDDFVIGSDPNFFGGVPEQLGQGRAHLFYGGADRRPAVSSISMADAVLRGRPEQAGFAKGMTAAGDVDGDGDGDLLIAENDWNLGLSETVAGSSYLLRGGDRLAGEVDATSSPRVAIISGEGLHGVFSAGLGDIDEDGRDDFALGGGATFDGDVVAFVFFGRADGFEHSSPVSTADVILRRDPALPHGAWMPIASAGDHDRDGHRDVIIGDPGLGDGRGGLYFISGQGMRWTGDGPVADVATTYVGSEQPVFDERLAKDPPWLPLDLAGASLDGDGDVDGDGHADLVVGATSDGDALGRAYLLRSPGSAASR
jgi:hypothetical protein